MFVMCRSDGSQWPAKQQNTSSSSSSSSSNPSLSLNPLLGILSCSFMPHIHLTILISARWSATWVGGRLFVYSTLLRLA